MSKWTVILAIISCQYALAQPDTANFKVTIRDDSLIKVLRRFIRIGQSEGLNKANSVLIMNASDQANHDQAEWFIYATNSALADVNKLKKFVPAYVSEIDGYSVIVYFRQHPDQFFEYPKAYIDYLDEKIYAKLLDKSGQQRLKTGSWKVTFIKGKSPIILGQL